MTKQNPFVTTFGIEPNNYIDRLKESEQIISEFSSENPSNYVYLISGIRGSGKTVLLSSIANHFMKSDEWIVVDPGPKDNILENVASEIYETGKVKHIFLEKEFSISFHGLTFSIKGKEPATTVNTLLKKMLDLIKKKGKKVLITIDEVDNSEQVKLFIQAYQSLIRLKYPVMLLMTGLYQNINKLQEDKTLTFLYRAPKIYIGPLALNSIASNYSSLLNISANLSIKLAKLTNGYAYAYQVLGYLFFKREAKDIDNELLLEFDQYLAEYVYDKVYSELSTMEQKIVKAFQTNESVSSSDIAKRINQETKYMSVYRSRLMKEGVIFAPSYGMLQFTLPRFNEFLIFK